MAYPDDRQYSKDHEWVLASGDTVDVGITDYAQAQLGDVVFVDLPAVGTAVTAGAAFGTIESVKAVSELFAPVTGEITEVNTSLADAPERVNTHPHDTWMVKIRVRGGTLSGLLDHAQYEALIA
jgi:glycine cleavage system H protein